MSSFYYKPFINYFLKESSDVYDFKIITHNIWSKNKNISDVYQNIVEEKPDIVFLQEIDQENYYLLKEDLSSISSDLSYSVFHKWDKMAIFSVFELEPKPRQNYERIKIQKAEISINDSIISLYNVHFLRGFREIRKKEIFKFYKADLLKNKFPVILAGDFNASVGMAVYETLEKNLINSHTDAGVGFGFTYPAFKLFGSSSLFFPGLIRIDHIFYSDNFRAIASQTPFYPFGSDHYPVLTKLKLIK